MLVQNVSGMTNNRGGSGGFMANLISNCLFAVFIAACLAVTGSVDVKVPPAAVAVAPLGLQPCPQPNSTSEWAWLEHLPHEIVPEYVAWREGAFRRIDVRSVPVRVSVRMMFVAEALKQAVIATALEALVYTGKDSTGRETWCIPVSVMSTALTSVWASLDSTTTAVDALVVLLQLDAIRLRLQDPDAVYGYAEQCRSNNGTLPGTMTLVSTWVSGEKVSWLDVSAGPFTWGSGVAGKGHHRPLALLHNTTVSTGQGSPYCVRTDGVTPILTSFLQQIVTPPSSLLPLGARSQRRTRHVPPRARHVNPDDDSDGAVDTVAVQSAAAKFPDRIMYRLFLVKSHAEKEQVDHPKPLSYMHTSHSPYNPSDALNVTAIRVALQAGKLPGQEVFVSVHSICVEEDVVIATALAASMRHVYVPRLTSAGVLEPMYQPYIDSDTLGSLLEPILVFSLDSTPTVMIDRHYVARPSRGVVFAVQGPVVNAPSQVFVNGEEVLIDARNPTDAVVRSALELVYGVVPANSVDDWSWSVGNDVTSVVGGPLLVQPSLVQQLHSHSIRFAADSVLQVTSYCEAVMAPLSSHLAGFDGVDPSKFVSKTRYDMFRHMLDAIFKINTELHAVDLSSLPSVTQLRSLITSAAELDQRCVALSRTSVEFGCAMRRGESGPSAMMTSVQYVLNRVGMTGIAVLTWVVVAVLVLFWLRRRKHASRLISTKAKIN